MVMPGILLAETSGNDVIRNWSAPAYWQADATSTGEGRVAAKAGEAVTVDTAPVPFVAISPCRLVDTRPENGFPPPYGTPALSPLVTRDFVVAGHCGVPVGAVAVSFNFTAVRTQGLGYLAAYPAGESWGGTSTLNYVAGQIVANSTAIGLGATGALTVFVSGSQSDLLIDINGYYGGTIVSSINGLDGDVELVAGTNIALSPSGKRSRSTLPWSRDRRDAGRDRTAGATGPQGAPDRRVPRGRRAFPDRPARRVPRVPSDRRAPSAPRVLPDRRARPAPRVPRALRVIRVRRELR
jgi:hypothetical protein